MTGIVCAIRGGSDSRATIEHSIQLALETGLPLYFLNIINLDFLMRTSSRLALITEEMRQLGEFILLTARNKAITHGAIAEGVIRQGNVREEISQLSNELAANFVVLGRPRGISDIDIFTQERFQLLFQYIERHSQAKVILAEG
jgi:hypothetical protein